MAFFIGAAFTDWLAARGRVPPSALRLSVGRDPRLSSPLVAASLVAGGASRGAAMSRLSLSTTPAMFMSCIMPGHGYDGAVMITASHLPVNRNGAKFFTPDGGLSKKDISVILNRAAQLAVDADMPASDRFNGAAYVIGSALLTSNALVRHLDFLPTYADHLKKIIIDGINHPTTPDKPLEGFKIVVNAGNGAGGFMATQVLAPLGADVSGGLP
jgi:phosphomannomutase